MGEAINEGTIQMKLHHKLTAVLCGVLAILTIGAGRKISDFTETLEPADAWLYEIAVPGVTNYKVTFGTMATNIIARVPTGGGTGEVTTAQLNASSNAVFVLETIRNAAVSNALVTLIGNGGGSIQTNRVLEWISPIMSFSHWWSEQRSTNNFTTNVMTVHLSPETNVGFGIKWAAPFTFESTNYYVMTFEARALQSNWKIAPYWGAYPLASISTNLLTTFSTYVVEGYGAGGGSDLYLYMATNGLQPYNIIYPGPGVVGMEVRNVTLARFRDSISTNSASASPSVSRSLSAEIQLPSIIYALPGVERNIYWRNITYFSGVEFAGLQFDTAALVGTLMNDGWRWTPEGTNTVPFTNILTVQVYYDATNLIASKAVSVVSGTLTNAGTRKALFVGDSTLATGDITLELLNTFTNDSALSLTLLGTKGTGATNKHEGISGWTADRFYTDPTSPFYRPGFGFDFNYYLTNNSYTMSSGDWVILRLGINDVFTQSSDSGLASAIGTATNALNLMALNVQSVVSGVRIGISLVIAPSETQDAFGANYGSYYPAWRYKRNRAFFNRACLALFEGRSGIFVIDDNSVIDGVNNMQSTTQAYNARNASTVSRQNNGVHPAVNGYNQVADLWRAVIKTLR